MISQRTIEEVLDLPVKEVVERLMGVTLKQQGPNYVGCCPFHQEKTGSFVVSPAKNYAKCFGCQEGGNSISLVMKYHQISYPEAIKLLCGEFNKALEEDRQTKPENKEKALKRESVYLLNEQVSRWYQEQLETAICRGTDYAKTRFDFEDGGKTRQFFRVGYAPESGLREWAKGNGYSLDLLVEAGLMKVGTDGHYYDFFRDRVMFPIVNAVGKVTGFTGRDHQADCKIKYLNTPESEFFHKRDILYGIDIARKSISRSKEFVLVEGNPDVLQLHHIGVDNAVGTNGTSLTDRQISSVRHLARKCIYIPDMDAAGINAFVRNSKLLLAQGIAVYAILIPTINKDEKVPVDRLLAFFNTHKADETARRSFQKVDAYDYFKSSEVYRQGLADMVDFYSFYTINRLNSAPSTSALKSEIIEELVPLIHAHASEAHRDMVINNLSTLIGPKRLWSDALKKYDRDAIGATKEEDEDAWKKDLSVQAIEDFEKYGYYEHKGTTWFAIKGRRVMGANFVLRPLVHVKGNNSSSRIYEIENEYGYKSIIELQQRELISLSSFRERTESLGNFVWTAAESQLHALKRGIFEKTLTGNLVEQLGWQKEGFFAFSNGIYDGKAWKPINNLGIVEFQTRLYYMPALSEIYKEEQSLYVFERSFKHYPGTIGLSDYMLKVKEVYGDNGMIGMGFYFGTLFRDIITATSKFPILFLFGPKGAGKTELAISLLQLFGRQKEGPNMHTATLPSMAKHISMVRNALVHMDEYRNDLDGLKREFLKGIWDSNGRTKMRMDMNNRSETSNVDAGVILSGQQMPTQDIALYSRTAFLGFEKTSYTLDERRHYNELKHIEADGLTHLTIELLRYREAFADGFAKKFSDYIRDLTNRLNAQNMEIDDRILKNWAIIITSYQIMASQLPLPVTFADFERICLAKMVEQNRDIKKSDEVGIFWHAMEFLLDDFEIRVMYDFKILLLWDGDEFLTDQARVIGSKDPRRILLLDHSRTVAKYQHYGKATGENTQKRDTIIYYLEHSKAYLGKKRSTKFRRDDVPGQETSQAKVTTSMVFDYEMLENLYGINLDRSPAKDDILEVDGAGRAESLPF